MEQLKTVLRRPLLAVILFLALQAVAGIAMTVVLLLISPSGQPTEMMLQTSENSYVTLLTATSSLSTNFIIIGLCLWLFSRKQYSPSPATEHGIGWAQHCIALMGCLLGIIAMDILSELLALPDLMEDMMIGMCRHPLGIVAIALMAPVAEEILFRWGVMGHILRKGCNPQTAIVVSSVLFGLAHLNPAQIFFGIIVGILLGLLYWKSNNILYPIILHILNNSIACILVWLLGDEVKDYSIVQNIGGTTTAWLYICLLSTLCVGIMVWYVKQGRAKNYNP